MTWAAQIEMFPPGERDGQRCGWAVESEQGAIRLCGAVAYWHANGESRLTLCDQRRRMADVWAMNPDGFTYLGELSDASRSRGGRAAGCAGDDGHGCAAFLLDVSYLSPASQHSKLALREGRDAKENSLCCVPACLLACPTAGDGERSTRTHARTPVRTDRPDWHMTLRPICVSQHQTAEPAGRRALENRNEARRIFAG